MTSTRDRGLEAERLAEEHLINKNYRLIQRNYLCKMGELDLVMSEGDTLVFVEVRSSQNTRAWIADSVGHAKQRRLKRAAQRWMLIEMKRHSIKFYSCRFDLVLVFGAALEHRKNVI